MLTPITTTLHSQHGIVLHYIRKGCCCVGAVCRESGSLLSTCILILILDTIVLRIFEIVHFVREETLLFWVRGEGWRMIFLHLQPCGILLSQILMIYWLQCGVCNNFMKRIAARMPVIIAL